ncbi:Calcineurin-like phosphoesterase domain, ApaH type [Anaerobutyricum hallii]|uniref:Calcineurin-like phosphoesterase domain, ApaH type n=1 Tax=Anaerobutyricum hallii TaxID=39488 RepID=A0A285PTV8_9FIRM|nr:metallophosphoesterase family protein [Anaerobutyricum hallii]SOB71250.1 Calcineurin-like phosphoesterase domain, ApaH type [Anaerobutyricum hallii]
MRKLMWKKAAAAAMTATILATSATVLQAAAPPDGYTNAQDTVEAYGGAYSNWMTKWNSTISKDREQISLSPGSDNSSLNFAWYTKKASGIQKLKIAENKRLTNAKVYEAKQTEAVTDKDDTAYVSNKVTATDLKANTTYYYSYQKDGQWTAPEKYTTDNGSKFSFIFVGDPQIGSSNELKGQDTAEFYNAQSAAVANDAFNWNTTLSQAMEKTNNKASFVLSSGDQIQSTKKKSPNKAAWGSEIEYSGYLSPDVLKNLPVATTVGNHDADNANYTYHFNTANASELGSNKTVGGDYWFKHDNALFIMLNTQDTNVEEHRQFIEQTVAANKDCKWRIVTLHQDIYGSAEHSNEPEITNLRYQLAPIFEDNKVDVVLTGHDHAYSRTQILKGGHKTTEYSNSDFKSMLNKDMDAGENPDTVYTAKENIKADTTDPSEKAYLDYLNQVMDKDAIQQVTKKGTTVFNPTGILYMTAGSSSGSKYYDLVPRQQSYIANRWQQDVPTYSVIDITDTTFTINTYRTDTEEKIDETFSIAKVNESENKNQTEDKKQPATEKKDTTKPIETAIAPKKAVLKKVKATGKKKVKIIVKKTSEKINGYEVILSTKKNFKKAKKVTTKENVVIVKKLKAGKKYFVKVRAFKKVGNKKIYGKYSTVKKVIVKK